MAAVKKGRAKPAKSAKLEGRMNIQVRAAANPTTQMAAALAEQTVNVSSRPTARTTPTGAESGINIEVPSGALHVSGAVGITEGADAVDAVGAVVTNPEVLRLLDGFEDALMQIAPLAKVLDAQRAKLADNLKGEPGVESLSDLPRLSELDITIGFGVSNVLRLHYGANQPQSAEALKLAANSLRSVGPKIERGPSWMSQMSAGAVGGILTQLPFQLSHEQWHQLYVSVSGILAALLQLLSPLWAS